MPLGGKPAAVEAHFLITGGQDGSLPGGALQRLGDTCCGNSQRAKGGGFAQQRSVRIQQANQSTLIDICRRCSQPLCGWAKTCQGCGHITEGEGSIPGPQTAGKVWSAQLHFGSDTRFRRTL